MKELKISLLQYDIVWENPEANKKKIEVILALHNIQSDVILLPEMFLTGFTMNSRKYAVDMNSREVQWFKDLSIKYNVAAGGTFIIKENENFYNRFIWVTPDGDLKFYDKQHLFSYGGEDKSFTKGKNKILLRYKDFSILPLVCYDLRFPDISDGKGEFDLIIYSSNWPGKRIYAFNQLLIARAIENQSYVAAINRIGKDGNKIEHPGLSQVIDPMGNVIASAGDREMILDAILSKEYLENVRTKYPFIKDK